MTSHLSRSDWAKLETPGQVQDQIDIRTKVAGTMVGQLYPSILADEVVDLHDIKRDLSKWVLQLIESGDYHEEKTIAAMERSGLDLPPRYISRKNDLWVLHEQHRPAGMTQRATYKLEGTDLRMAAMHAPLPEMMKWETWSND